MTTEPLEPNLGQTDEDIPAADPGPGAPPTSPGTGPEPDPVDRPDPHRATDAVSARRAR